MPASWLTRRAILGGLAAAFNLLPAAALARSGFPLAVATPPALKSSWRKIGRRYLAQTPGERDRRTLEAMLPDGCHRLVTRGTCDTSALQAFYRRRSDEFRTGDTVVVHGWVLARSEARLCALAALSA